MNEWINQSNDFLVELDGHRVLLELAADVAEVVEQRLPRLVDGFRVAGRVDADHIDGLGEALVGQGVVAVLVGHRAQFVEDERIVGCQRVRLAEETVGQSHVVHQSVLQAHVEHGQVGSATRSK